MIVTENGRATTQRASSQRFLEHDTAKLIIGPENAS